MRSFYLAEEGGRRHLQFHKQRHMPQSPFLPPPCSNETAFSQFLACLGALALFSLFSVLLLFLDLTFCCPFSCHKPALYSRVGADQQTALCHWNTWTRCYENTDLPFTFAITYECPTPRLAFLPTALNLCFGLLLLLALPCR
ncbi:hypothetical protein B0H67DRAFT_162611 [Lasiosphaeris hirsuta]|uniref:Uncharacterized protein n=1 Tax=Lasiosphaeris hirsuta TaxID=260670 RepID=A0AA40E0G8_9PEZI|nr:hypothetical protein B0H67DRAFT_162611 [Lasiosphaeris hirsuta]